MAKKPGYWTSLHGLATLILIGAALYFIFVEHGEHVLPYLFFMIILLCPLMHFFMHKGHSEQGHGGDKHQGADEAYRRGLEEGRKESSRRP
jgi:DMSO/TMAO reductase YedYZ heme-binding membrane subunit